VSMTIEFTFGACITVDATADDCETGPETYRATYRVLDGDVVVVDKIERNEARPGKPANWWPDRLDHIAHMKLEETLTKAVRRERMMREMATLDEE
jgi:hypothetical protein